jgi:hypothetical protein
MANRKRLAALVIAALCSTTGVIRAEEQPGRGGQQYQVRMTPREGMIVKMAITGAIRRLGTESCQRVFDDFTDPSGLALSANLRATGKAAGGALAALYFAEGDGTSQCRSEARVVAFTEPGSHVVHVCGARFAKFGANIEVAEILLIHELLHSLGLAENPPTSGQITDTVRSRCSR